MENQKPNSTYTYYVSTELGSIITYDNVVMQNSIPYLVVYAMPERKINLNNQSLSMRSQQRIAS